MGSRKESYELVIPLAAFLVVLALFGCAPAAVGPGPAPNAPYQQGDPRDTSGMH